MLGARELDQSGLNDGDRNWSNLHTVYTHGNGIIAAYANQRGADDNSEGTDIQWAEGNQTNADGSRQDALSKAVGGYESRIYFGEQSPSYSVVGKEKDDSPSVELGLAGATEDEEQTTTYDGDGGVPIGSTFRQLLYAIKFGEPNFLLSGRVHGGSEILYNRTPRERVEKVAPWLTIDDDSYPAIVDGKIVWIVDGYTTTDRYPFSEKESFEDMTDDSLQEQTGLQTLPTDEINYMRNAVKATVDAYDGTVTLYAWDEEDPILQTWRNAFPGTVKDRSEISDELMEHLRYPEDLFKVQRYHYARYHVTDAGDWYQGNDRWAVPRDPNSTNDLQPPYRLFNEGADAGEGCQRRAGLVADLGVRAVRQGEPRVVRDGELRCHVRGLRQDDGAAAAGPEHQGSGPDRQRVQQRRALCVRRCCPTTTASRSRPTATCSRSRSPTD